HLVHRPHRDARSVTLAGEHAEESAATFHRVHPFGGAGLTTDQLEGSVRLVLGLDGFQGRVGRLGVHSFAWRLLSERATGEPALVVPGAHQHLGIGGVVDQPDLGEPVQHLGDDLVRDVPARHLLRELRPGPGRPGEHPQGDRPGDTLLVRFGILGRRTRGGWLLPRCGPSSCLAHCTLTFLHRPDQTEAAPSTAWRSLPAAHGAAYPSEVDRCLLRLRHRLELHADAELGLDLLLDLDSELRVVLEEPAGVLLALAELVALVGVPGAGLAHDAVLHPEVDQAALAGDAHAVDDVELGLLERRGHLVLHHLRAGAVADRVGALLEGLDAAHVDADGGAERQRLAARDRLRRVVHHARVA